MTIYDKVMTDCYYIRSTHAYLETKLIVNKLHHQNVHCTIRCISCTHNDIL